MRHGHAISIDMAFSATLARELGLLSGVEHERLLRLFSRAGLSIDDGLFDEVVLDKGTAAILKTRDGQLRLAVPSPLGTPKFVNELSNQTLVQALELHKSIVAKLPRKGAGLLAYVDASDTGEGDVTSLLQLDRPSLSGPGDLELRARPAAVVNAS